MHKFYLTSECTPVGQDLHSYTALFTETLKAYQALVDQSALKVFKGVVTEKSPSEMPVGNGFSLRDVLDHISDKEGLKTLAYSYFIKYPFENHTTIEYEWIGELYSIAIGGIHHRIEYLAFAAKNKSIGFTVPTHDDLRINPLTFRADGKDDLRLVHLYSAPAAIAFVSQSLQQINNQSLSLFERLLSMLPDPVYDPRFEKDFNTLSNDEQRSIFNKFETAIASGYLDQPDSKAVKDVSPANGKSKVLELRVFSPSVLRVYFNKVNNRIYIAMVGDKNGDQNKDIQQASNTLFKLLQTNP